VPSCWIGPADLAACIEQLEVHHLSSVDGALHYALLSDGPMPPPKPCPKMPT
jgi:cyclic beta-1,2-glucan synthetase